MVAAAAVLGTVIAVVALGAPAAVGAAGERSVPASGGVSPVLQVSRCAGQNAEVEQGVSRTGQYVYEAWIGCGGIGFARSTDGGRHFGGSMLLPGSSHSDDPAVAVAPNGTVYVSFLRYANDYGYPVVDASFDHGASFPQVSSLIPPFKGNWGDRDFIAVAGNGDVYVTWDYGPTAAAVKFQCSPTGSCAYAAVDATAVVQKSTDGGKTWGSITPMEPNFPAGGGYSAPLLVQPNGQIDALVLNHPISNPITYTVQPGHEYFTASTDGGKKWTPLHEIGSRVGTLSLQEWWIDGDIAMDSAGILYATWDTQTAHGDIGWLSFSTDHGKAWSAPARVTPAGDGNAVHIVEVVGGTRGIAYVAWQTDASPLGYATYLRPYSTSRGWLAPTIQVSNQYGSTTIWPGDTFGISLLSSGPQIRLALSWGSAIENHKDSEIYAAVVTLPARL